MAKKGKRTAEIEEIVTRRREYLDGNAPAGMGPEPSKPPEPSGESTGEGEEGKEISED